MQIAYALVFGIGCVFPCHGYGKAHIGKFDFSSCNGTGWFLFKRYKTPNFKTYRYPNSRSIILKLC